MDWFPTSQVAPSDCLSVTQRYVIWSHSVACATLKGNENQKGLHFNFHYLQPGFHLQSYLHTDPDELRASLPGLNQKFKSIIFLNIAKNMILLSIFQHSGHIKIAHCSGLMASSCLWHGLKKLLVMQPAPEKRVNINFPLKPGTDYMGFFKSQMFFSLSNLIQSSNGTSYTTGF